MLIVNLSDRVLTASETRVLSKGLNFCPTQRDINRFESVKDLTEFRRRMKCRAYFGLDGESDRQPDKITHFKEKSKWSPENVDPALDLFLKALEEKVLLIKEEGNNYSNLTGEERKALKDLKNYRDIVIKGADKGSAVVVWGLEDYCKEAYDQLGDDLIHEKNRRRSS